MTIIKWTALVLLALVMLLAGGCVYVMRSVDPAVMPANHGQVETRFFIGADSTHPRPLVVALGGAEGGNAWTSARWGAERQKFLDDGYAFLAIGYFAAPGTPKQLDRIALEGVYDAIERTAQRPDIDRRCIAVVGVSKGAELALLLASRYPEIDAVAAVVPGSAVFVGHTNAMTTSSFSHNGQSLPFVPLPWRATVPLITGNKRKVYDIMMADTAAMGRAAIPVERINGPVFFLSATRDEFWNSRGMADAMMVRLKAKHFPYATAHVAIEGDHASPTKHFDEVRAFLAAHFKARAAMGCAALTELPAEQMR